jgi:flagellar biosynthetic protein FlhB
VAETQAQERTERPTPKRLDEARKKGQVPRSLDLSSAAVVLAGAGLIYALGSSFAQSLAEMLRGALTLSASEATEPSLMWPKMVVSFGAAFSGTLPVLMATLAAALAAPLVTGGWNFSAEALTPKLERLNPIAGFGRMFSARSLVELLKAIAKFALVGLIAVLLLWMLTPQLLGLSDEPIGYAIRHAGSLCGMALLALTAGLVVIAVLDAPYQLWSHQRELRMTREEVREEMKESEGSPEIKGRVRALQQAMARGRMMQDVPKADVVITNPTHYSVALRYDDAKMRAPIVVAKGVDLIAARIREIAAESDVPIVEAPPLARALHRSVEIGGEVPAGLYIAVAQVLTYVYQVRAAKASGRTPPSPPTLDPTLQ